MEARPISTEELKEATEHKQVLVDLNSVLQSPAGNRLFKYLFKYFEIAKTPDFGHPENMLRELNGYNRAGEAIFDLACEANFEIAGAILAKVKKELYDEKVQQFING